MYLAAGLKNSRELLDVGTGDARQQPRIGVEFDFQAGKFLRVRDVNLSIERILHYLIGNRSGQSFLCRGDIGCGIGHVAQAAVNFFVQKVAAQLRIKNLSGQNGKRQQQQHGNDGDKQVGDDQAVPQTP